jgi:hypothetical protein
MLVTRIVVILGDISAFPVWGTPEDRNRRSGLTFCFQTRSKTHTNVWQLMIVLIVHTVCVVIGASVWLYLEIHDPSVKSCWGSCLPTSERWTKVRYCAIHRAKIVGLDHHCTWLNTTVGRYNYIPFFSESAAISTSRSKRLTFANCLQSLL